MAGVSLSLCTGLMQKVYTDNATAAARWQARSPYFAGFSLCGRLIGAICS